MLGNGSALGVERPPGPGGVAGVGLGLGCWAIVNGEEQTGVTTMRIVQELDAGPILLQTATAIHRDETAPQLMERLAQMGAELLSATLQNLSAIQAQPQLDADASFAPILKREDGLIDWSMDAPAIDRRVRGLQPWPNAFTTFDSRRLIVWHSEPVAGGASASGSILVADRDNLIVACGGETALRLLEVQPEDSRRMSARDFVNGARLKPGQIMGKA